jgi:hypothetical protein
MRALKYGLFIAAGVAGWVMLKHFAIKQSVSPWVDAVVFNAMELIGLALGIGERRAQLGGLTIGEGVRTGISIAAVYAVAGCVFFAVLYSAVGPGLLQYAQEPGTGERSASAVLAGAFAGLFIGALLSGLVFSLLLSVLMRSRTPSQRISR